MRVLIVTNMWPDRADPSYGVFVRDQVKALRALGNEIDVHFVDGRRSRLNYARAVPAVRRRAATGRYALVHAHYVLSGVVAWAAARARRSPPLLVTHHGIEVFEGWQARLAAWLTGRVDRTLVVSPAMARHLGLSPEAVVPMGVDLERFRPGPRDAARAALGLPLDRPLVGWVGVDRPEKRLGLARAAVSRLGATVPLAALHVVTGRPHAEVPLHLQAVDCLLLTSRNEGAPVVVKEALACDLPVVSTDVGDVRDVVGEVEGCAVVEGAAEALAGGLRRALAFGPVSGREVAARYAAPVIAARLDAIYRDLAVGSSIGEESRGSALR